MTKNEAIGNLKLRYWGLLKQNGYSTDDYDESVDLLIKHISVMEAELQTKDELIQKMKCCANCNNTYSLWCEQNCNDDLNKWEYRK